MPKYSPPSYEQILQKLVARMVARTGLTDVSDTSVAKHLCAGFARGVDELYYQSSQILQYFSIDSATGDDLDARAKDIQPGQIQRRVAQKATGVVVFSRSVVSGTVTIPAGTQIKTGDNVTFETGADAVISPTSAIVLAGHTLGQDSNLVGVTAVVPGSAGNVVAQSVVKFAVKPPGVDSVVNPSACSQGQDKETDDSFRARIKDYVAGLARATTQSLESGVLGAQNPATGATILFSRAVEDDQNPGKVTLYVDDGTGTAQTSQVVTGENVTQGLSGPPVNRAVGGETRLYLDLHPVAQGSPFTLVSSTRGTLTSGAQYRVEPTAGLIIFSPALVTGEMIQASYTVYTGLLALAQKIVDGDPNDRVNYPGLRAAGIQVLVAPPQVVLITVSAVLTVTDGYDVAGTQAAVKQAILDYINGLQISGDVLRASLYQQVMNVPGAANVIISAPDSDLPILDGQIARTTPTNVTVQ